MAEIICIVSGGQSGVDRAALNAARKLKIKIRGWCPKDGWAEDRQNPPGVRSEYPELKETEERDVSRRTCLNVRDSDATLIITDESISHGTDLTEEEALRLGKPYLTVSADKSSADKAVKWIRENPSESISLNIAGPRESESPGIYEKAEKLITALIRKVNEIQTHT